MRLKDLLKKINELDNHILSKYKEILDKNGVYYPKQISTSHGLYSYIQNVYLDRKENKLEKLVKRRIELIKRLDEQIKSLQEEIRFFKKFVEAMELDLKKLEKLEEINLPIETIFEE